MSTREGLGQRRKDEHGEIVAIALWMHTGQVNSSTLRLITYRSTRRQ